MTAFFGCLELPGQTKRSAPLEAVEVSVYWDTFATAATLYAAAIKLAKSSKTRTIKTRNRKETRRYVFCGRHTPHNRVHSSSSCAVRGG